MLSLLLAAQEIENDSGGFDGGTLLWVLLVIVLILGIVYLVQRIR